MWLKLLMFGGFVLFIYRYIVAAAEVFPEFSIPSLRDPSRGGVVRAFLFFIRVLFVVCNIQIHVS